MTETTQAPQEQTNQAPIAHKNVHAALLAAKKNMGEVFKNASNPHFQSQYADLGNIVEVVEEPLQNEGILLSQPFYTRDSVPYVKTILHHVDSDTTIECEVEVKSSNPNDPQKVGSALTYYRRYTLQSVLGIAPKDDDGNAAAPAPVSKPQYVATRKPASQQSVKTAPQPSTETVPCEVPNCRNTIRKVVEQQNRTNHDGHAICQLHHTNGDWKAAIERGADPETGEIPSSTFDENEAAFVDSLNNPQVTVNPDGSATPVKEAA